MDKKNNMTNELRCMNDIEVISVVLLAFSLLVSLIFYMVRKNE